MAHPFVPLLMAEKLKAEISDRKFPIENTSQNEKIEIATQRETYYAAQQQTRKRVHLYVLSNAHFAAQHIFKIGVHKGSQESLARTHEDVLMYPTFYFWMPMKEAAKIRQLIFESYPDLVIKDNGGQSTEWMKDYGLVYLLSDIMRLYRKEYFKKKEKKVSTKISKKVTFAPPHKN